MPPERATNANFEARAWRSVFSGWKPLHGSFDHQGFSLEAHDFPLESDLDWGRSFHPESVELCLNLNGSAVIECRGKKTTIAAETAVFYRVGSEPLAAAREAGGRHRFITLECRRDWLLR